MKPTIVILDKNTIDSMPRKEFVFFVSMGIVLNDIMANSKLLACYHNKLEGTTEENIKNYQVVAALIEQTGRFYECKKMINAFYSDSDIRDKYNKNLSNEGKAALGRFNDILRSDKYSLIRNKLSNHYDIEQIEQIIETHIDHVEEISFMTTDEESGWAYTRFFISDILKFATVLQIFGCDENGEKEQMEKAYDDFWSESIQLNDLLQIYMIEVIKIFLDNFEKVKLREVEDISPTPIRQVKIPFFLSRD